MAWRRPVAWSLTGLALAEVSFAASLTPSLLPRAAVVQAAVGALALLTGYALGAVLGAVARALAAPPSWSDRARRVTVWLLALGAGAGVALAVAAAGVQAEQARSIGSSAAAPAAWVSVPLAVLLAWLVLTAARWLRVAAHAMAAVWARRVGVPAVATTLGGVTVAAFVLGGVVLAYQGLHLVFERLDESTAGQSPPTSTARSGGPGSLVPWDSLGAEGRSFVSGGPTPGQIAAFDGRRSAPEPVRVFVGLQSAPDAAARAALAVDELRRTGGLDRSTVVVITSTGNGFVDPVAADSLEYVLGGDVASAAIQYSVLPSWISFLVDQSASRDAGTELLAAVSAAVAARPEEDRPRLVVYGESLGAYGSQAAFAADSPQQVVAQVDAALWVGPPAASQPWQSWTGSGATGPPWQPVVDDGAVVQSAATASAIAPDDPVWGPRRVLVAQHATDPVVWFDATLAWSTPDWLAEPRGPGVPAAMRWWPLLTLQQVLLDLPAAVSAPPGAGHDYAGSVPEGWVAVLQPPGWTADDTVRLLAAAS